MLGFLFETGKPLSVTLETSVDGWMDKQATQSGSPKGLTERVCEL